MSVGYISTALIDVGNQQPESRQHYFSLESSTAQSREVGSVLKDACIPFFLLLSVEGMWSAVTSFCPCDFPPVMDHNTKLWTKINPLSPKLLALGVFRCSSRKGSQAGNYIPIQIFNGLQFSPDTDCYKIQCSTKPREWSNTSFIL